MIIANVATFFAFFCCMAMIDTSKKDENYYRTPHFIISLLNSIAHAVLYLLLMAKMSETKDSYYGYVDQLNELSQVNSCVDSYSQVHLGRYQEIMNPILD